MLLTADYSHCSALFYKDRAACIPVFSMDKYFALLIYVSAGCARHIDKPLIAGCRLPALGS